MIKKTVFFVIYIYVWQQINAQLLPICGPRDISKMTTVDSGNMRVLYALNAVDINKPETYDDLQRLETGSHLSKYYSYFIYRSDSLCTDWRKKHPNAGSMPSFMGNRGKDRKWSEYYWSEYFKDFSKNVYSEYVCMPLGIQNYKYSESITAQNWILDDDTLTVTGYLCQKATCTFGGRNYTAWFTADIPVSNGPWKFGGLPGLILKVYDNDKLYIFECVHIEINMEKYPIKMFDYANYVKIERKNLLKLQKETHENFDKVAGVKVTYYLGDDINNLGNEIPPPPKVIYHPLELE
jgi:GLPGLI family protein